MATFQGSPAASADDGYISFGTLDNSDIAISFGFTTFQPGFVRFINVAIPPGATIISAVITVLSRVTADLSETHITTIDGLAEDDSAQIADGSDFGTRPHTSTSATGNGGNWTDGEPIALPDCAVQLQEIIDRAGWEENNAVQFALYSTADDLLPQFDSFDRAGGTPARLDVNYTVPASGGGIGSARFNRLLKPA